MHHVALPIHYFRTAAKREYSDWRRALIREFLQNSIDARAYNFEINLSETETYHILTVKDNGHGMALDDCIHKLLTMGGSGKSENDIGGFGVAKGLLFFAWDRWELHSRNYKIVGEGCQYNIEETSDYVYGVHATIHIDKSEYFDIDYVTSYLSQCETNARITINGNLFENKKLKGRKLKSFDWGTLYKAKTIHGQSVQSSYLSVRVNGVQMFHHYVSSDLDCRLTLELTGKTREILTSNRDGLKEPYTKLFQALVQDIATNVKSSTNEKDEIIIQRIIGAGLERVESPRKIIEIVNHESHGRNLSAPFSTKEERPTVPSQYQQELEPEIANIDFPDVLIKTVGRKLPKKFHPLLWPYKIKTIMKLWTLVLRQILIDNKLSCNFGIGLSLDPHVEAEFINYEDTPFFLLNMELWNQVGKSKKGKALLPKVNGKHGWMLIQELKQRAAHEIGHYVTGKDHNEKFIGAVHALEANTWTNEDQYKTLLKSISRRNRKKVVDSISN